MMETAVVARGRVFHRPAQGQGSSHLAEFLALLHALDVAAELGAQDIVLLGDSLTVVEQANKRLPCRSARIRECLAAFEEKARAFASVRVRHIKRTQNLAGIALGKLREATTSASMYGIRQETRS
ncbi:reverse transcriptase-like protein [Sphingosinicella rhizophila]|uniref:Reverse transcriptase-like protein n=1 Tax=Sphingosinicella rhizophila TaxID=3050082 RepID=A0ABU3Q9W7_9SPHN|nr:reverse transcriptase-like protein [Sphingosinicella sp. GR2756]MDT9600102.1 reverse transcriptase-like protein [Sphingosinicella sp. GR2756]